jgi:hypothetical protein
MGRATIAVGLMRTSGVKIDVYMYISPRSTPRMAVDSQIYLDDLLRTRIDRPGTLSVKTRWKRATSNTKILDKLNMMYRIASRYTKAQDSEGVAWRDEKAGAGGLRRKGRSRNKCPQHHGMIL